MSRRRTAFTWLTMVLLLAWSEISAASAALPRTFVKIQSASVKLSDLFSGLEPGQDCTIGDAPAAGSRIFIASPQLVAIAEQFGVDWLPDVRTVGVTVEREARFIGSDELMPPIQSALEAAGAGAPIDIVLSRFDGLSIPAEEKGHPALEAFNFDRANGHFTADLLFGASSRLRIKGIAREMILLPVLTHSLSGGSIITTSDLVFRRVRRDLVPDHSLLTAEGGVGLALRHQASAGKPIPVDELVAPLLIRRGMPVILRLENPGLVLSAKGETLEDGALGDRVHVVNPTSGAILVGRVIGPGTVQVDPSNVPLLPGAARSGLFGSLSLASVGRAGRTADYDSR